MTTDLWCETEGSVIHQHESNSDVFPWRGGGASAFLFHQDLVELVSILGGLDPDEEGEGGVGVLVVDRRVGDANQHHVVLPKTRARHRRLQDDVQQDVSCRGGRPSAHTNSM